MRILLEEKERKLLNLEQSLNDKERVSLIDIICNEVNCFSACEDCARDKVTSIRIKRKFTSNWFVFTG